MLFLKKSILSSMVVAVALVLAGSAAVAAPAAAPAGDTIGVIDSQEIVAQHPKFKQATEELQKIARQKENEAKMAADKETEPAKKAQVVQAKRMELAKEEQRLMEPIFTACQQAVRKVAVDQKVTLVLEKASIYIGGKDITQDVILELKKPR